MCLCRHLLLCANSNIIIFYFLLRWYQPSHHHVMLPPLPLLSQFYFLCIHWPILNKLSSSLCHHYCFHYPWTPTIAIIAVLGGGIHCHHHNAASVISITISTPQYPSSPWYHLFNNHNCQIMPPQLTPFLQLHCYLSIIPAPPFIYPHPHHLHCLHAAYYIYILPVSLLPTPRLIPL